MPRYIVQRTFPDGLHIPVDNGGADTCRAVIERNSEEGVTWIHSYVSEDKTCTFCVYDGRTRSQYAPRPSATDCPSIGSRASACSTPTSTAS